MSDLNQWLQNIELQLRVMPNNVFMKRDPIVCGVVVEAGVVKTGTPICVPSKVTSGHISNMRSYW